MASGRPKRNVFVRIDEVWHSDIVHRAEPVGQQRTFHFIFRIQECEY